MTDEPDDQSCARCRSDQALHGRGHGHGYGRERQAAGLPPWALALSGMAAGAALFAAGGAVMRMLL